MTPEQLWNEYKTLNPAIGDKIDAWAFGASWREDSDSFYLRLVSDK